MVATIPPSLAPCANYPLPPPIQLREPQDTYDMLDPRWECPAGPRHPHLSAAMRGINRTAMRPLLGLGRVAMGGLLRLGGFHRGYVSTRGGELNYFDGKGQGTLPPIVLVLGIGGTTTDYLKMLNRLKKDYSRVIAIDLPGHGYSKAPPVPMDDASVVGAMADAINQLVEPGTGAILLGHSLGGYIAARYAAAHPERLGGLVLAEPTGAPFSPTERQSFDTLYSLETRKKARTVIHNAFYNDGKNNPFIVSAAWARLTSPVARQMIRSDLFTTALQPQNLSGLQMPVLLIWGQDDHLLPANHYYYFADNLPRGTEFVLPEHINHNNAAVGPPQIVNPVIAFSQKVVDGTAGRSLARPPLRTVALPQPHLETAPLPIPPPPQAAGVGQAPVRINRYAAGTPLHVMTPRIVPRRDA